MYAKKNYKKRTNNYNQLPPPLKSLLPFRLPTLSSNSECHLIIRQLIISIAAGRGTVFVIKPSDKLEIIARNEICENWMPHQRSCTTQST